MNTHQLAGKSYAGKTGVVTGASAGIGRAAAELFGALKHATKRSDQ